MKETRFKTSDSSNEQNWRRIVRVSPLRCINWQRNDDWNFEKSVVKSHLNEDLK